MYNSLDIIADKTFLTTLFILVILGLWKAVEIIIWVVSHLHWS